MVSSFKLFLTHDYRNEQVAAIEFGIDDSFKGIVSHSLIVSTALYKMEHKDRDEELISQYLYKQIENYFFEYIIPSKHG